MSEEGEWAFTASVWFLACTQAHHVVAILNSITFLAVALNFKRPINGIPCMQKHDPLCNEHVKCTSLKTTQSAICVTQEI